MTGLEELDGKPYGTPVYLAYEAPEIRRREVLRYAGVRADAAKKTSNDGSGQTDMADGMEALLEDVIRQASDALTYRAACLRLTLDAGAKELSLAEYFSASGNLMKNLSGCSEVILFAATVGAGIDRLIRRYERIEPARSLLFQAYGAERVESLCDLINQDINRCVSEFGWSTHPRFSPGYGDLSLEIQPVLLSLLDAERRLGITLGTSLLMSPSKSVTAVIGLEKTE